MRDPAMVLELVEATTGKLDAISKALAAAHDGLTAAEEAWDEHFDTVAESLTEDYREQARKADPAEHTIKSVARRQNRAVYQEWRRCRRQVEMLEKLATNRSNELSGYQSELSLAKAEARVA